MLPVFVEAKAGRKPRTVAEYKRHMERHFLPRFETRKLPEMTYEELMDAVKDLPPGEQAQAFTAALAKPGLNDRSDPMVEMVARRIITAALAGERNPIRLTEIGASRRE